MPLTPTTYEPMANPPEEVLRRSILQKARALRDEHWERGEIQLTSLVEEVAHELGHAEWLDDPSHLVWEMVIEAAEEVDGLR